MSFSAFPPKSPDFVSDFFYYLRRRRRCFSIMQGSSPAISTTVFKSRKNIDGHDRRATFILIKKQFSPCNLELTNENNSYQQNFKSQPRLRCKCFSGKVEYFLNNARPKTMVLLNAERFSSANDLFEFAFGIPVLRLY